MRICRKNTWNVLVCAGLLALAGVGCTTGPPDGITPVTGFEMDRYLGEWYEIARLDHAFERGLRNVTATYSRNDDGTIAVENRGYDTEKEAWDVARGKARFRGDPTVGSLEVSFFGPFYGGYHIFELDEDYQYALVAGPTKHYLWILCRTPTMTTALYQELLGRAASVGYVTGNVIVVDQSPPNGGEGGTE